MDVFKQEYDEAVRWEPFTLFPMFPGPAPIHYGEKITYGQGNGLALEGKVFELDNVLATIFSNYEFGLVLQCLR